MVEYKEKASQVCEEVKFDFDNLISIGKYEFDDENSFCNTAKLSSFNEKTTIL